MNKSIKKIIASFLAISVISTGLVYADIPSIDDVPFESNADLDGKAPAEVMAENGVENSYKLLNYLGIVPESKEEILVSDLATNALAADWFSRVLDQNSTTGITLPYKDVTDGTEHYEGILRAYRQGIIPETDKFNPTASLTKENAARIAMYTVDYDVLYEDSGALAFAEDKNLFNGVEISEGVLTVGGLMRFIENTLNTDNINYSITGPNQYDITIDENTSYLEKKKDIIVQRGIITAVDYSSMYDHSVVMDGNIEINRGNFLYDGVKSFDMVGKNVEAYVDTADEKRIITIREYRNEVIEIKGIDFENSANGYINYTQEGKSKREKLSSDTRVLYNDLYFGTNQEAIDNGKYTTFDRMIMIDNNYDEKIDVIKVYKSDTYIVNRISTIGERIDLQNGYDSIYVNADNTRATFILNGAEIGYEELVNSDVLSVFRADSDYGNIYYNIIVSRDRVADVLSGQYEDSDIGRKYYSIAGENYELTDEFIDFLENNVTETKPIMGKEATFLMTYDGRIAGVLPMSSGFTYGYLMRAYYGNEENDEAIIIKVYSWTNGAEKIELKEKVKFYNETDTEGKKVDAKDVYDYLNKGGSLLYDMVAYKQNAQGLITEFAVPLDTSEIANFTPGSIEYPLTKDYTNFKGEYKKDEVTGENKPVFESVRSYNHVVGSIYPSGSTGTILFPFNTAARDDERQFGRRTFSYSDEYFDTTQLALYNVDEFFKPGLIAVGASVGTAPSTESSAYMIAKVEKVLNENDEPCMQISYYIGNTLTTKTFAENCIRASDSFTWHGQTSPQNIKVGDIVQLSQDNLGNINSVKYLYKSNNPSPFGYQDPSGGTMTSVRALKVIHGKVDSYSSSVVLVDYGTVIDGKQIWPIATGWGVYGNTTFVLYDSKTGEVKPVSRNEMKKGDEIVVRKRFNHGVDFFIIR